MSDAPDKNEVARALLLQGTVYVHLDPRVAGVSVPKQFRNDHQLVLQVGFDMPIPIRDLRVDEEGVRATLSFQRVPYLCEVPWASVFALVGEDGRGQIWPESLPAEIRGEIAREARRRQLDPSELEVSFGDDERDDDDAGEIDTPDNIRRLPSRPRAAPRPAAEPRTRETGPSASPEPPIPPRSGPSGPKRPRPSHLRVVK